VDAQSGDARWADPFDAGSPVRSAVAFAGGGIIAAARDGEVYKLDPATGEQMGGVISTDSTVEANLTSEEDIVYAVPRSANLFVIDAAGDLAQEVFPLPE
jgi:hypothetical protein